MSKVFDYVIDRLGKESGYGYDFLIDRWNEMIEETGDWDYEEFARITMNHEW